VRGGELVPGALGWARETPQRGARALGEAPLQRPAARTLLAYFRAALAALAVGAHRRPLQSGRP
jgi:hypothetical protein